MRHPSKEESTTNFTFSILKEEISNEKDCKLDQNQKRVLLRVFL